jgi:uncharacterized protein YkwD
VTSGNTRRPIAPALVAAVIGICAAGAVTVLTGFGHAAINDGSPVAVADSHSQLEDEVVDLVNRARAEAGCDPVTVDPRLDYAAEAHSRDMAQRDYFDHTTPEGLNFRDRIRNAGYSNPATGENLAHGQRTAAEVMDGWMASEGHRANILNCEFVLVGIGLDEDGMYWTQDFGAS